MKLKMFEYFQGRDVSALLLPRQVQVTVLEPGNEYEVDDLLGDFLLKSRKAERVVSATVERVARHLDVEPQFEQAEEPPRPAPRKRGKRS